MKKKILIGSMLVLTLLLLMPSIPAIQQKSIEEGFKQELQEKLETITLDELMDIKDLEGIRHPILYTIVIFLLSFRYACCLKLGDISFESDYWGGVKIKRPLLFFRALWLVLTIEIWCLFWNSISDKLGWDWNISLGSIPDNWQPKE